MKSKAIIGFILLLKVTLLNSQKDEKKIRYFNTTEFGLNIISKSSKTEFESGIGLSRFNGRIVNGIVLKNKFSIGISTGILRISPSVFSQYLYPIGIDAKFHRTRNNTTYTLGINSGHTFGENNLGLVNYSPGLFFSPHIGIGRLLNEKINIFFNLNFAVQNIKYSFDLEKLENPIDMGDPLLNTRDKIYDQKIQIISISLGLRFN
jgi:hypothetical protein